MQYKDHSIQSYFWPVLVLIVFVVNYLAQHSDQAIILYHVFSISYIFVLLYSRFLKPKTTLVICLVYFMIFHNYSADPYNDSFVSFLAGPYKYITLIVAISCIKKFHRLASLAILFIILITLLEAINGQYFRVHYLGNDAIFYLFAIILISGRVGEDYTPNFKDIKKLLYNFYQLLPCAYLLVYLAGISVMLFGSIYFFYGHLFNFIVILGAIFYFQKEKKTVFDHIPFVVNTFVFIQSLQSAYILIILLSLVMYLYRGKIKHTLIFIFVIVISVYSISLLASDGSWVKLKFTQVYLLFSLAFEPVALSFMPNSFAIRLAEIQNIFAGNSDINNIFGRGLGAIYFDNLKLFFLLDMHEATFPPMELSSGEFHTVHETIFRLFLHFGIFGLFSATFIYFRGISKSSDFSDIFVCTFCFLLFLSNVQVSSFLMIYIVIMGNNYFNKTAEKSSHCQDATLK